MGLLVGNRQLDVSSTAFGTHLEEKLEGDKGGFYHWFKEKTPKDFEMLKGYFQSFAPLLMGAKNGNMHPEILHHLKDIVREQQNAGVTSFSNNGYALLRLKTILEAPNLYKEGLDVWHSFTGELIDMLGDQGKVFVGKSPSLEGFGDYEEVKINGRRLNTHLVRQIESSYYYKLYYEQLLVLEGLGLQDILIETAHNSHEIQALLEVAADLGYNVTTSFYPDRTGSIPDPHGRNDVAVMFKFVKMLDEKKGVWKGGGFNCLTREVAIDLTRELKSDPEVAKYNNYLAPNASKYAYDNLYGPEYAYKKPLIDFLIWMATYNTHLSDVTGCCGCFPKDIQQGEHQVGCAHYQDMKPAIILA